MECVWVSSICIENKHLEFDTENCESLSVAFERALDQFTERKELMMHESQNSFFTLYGMLHYISK